VDIYAVRPEANRLPKGLCVIAKVEVWRASVRCEPGDEALLSPPELARAALYRRQRDRRRFVGSRTFLRRLLSRKTGLPPRSLEIGIAPNGKPFLANAPLHFSISHSASLVLVAISSEAEVGVDIEWMNTGVDFLPVAARNFTREEYAALHETHGRERVRLFYRLWTLREARLKAWGCGCTAAVPPPETGATTRFSPLAAPRGFRAALAVYAPAAGKSLDVTPECRPGSRW
jgi:phosphopantetheinyl transferase